MADMYVESIPDCEVCKFRGRKGIPAAFFAKSRRGWYHLCGNCADLTDVRERRRLVLQETLR